MNTHVFGDVIVSEIVIDIELKRNKGRVTREKAMNLALVANAIRTQRNEFRELFEAAKVYISKCPCDPDIYPEQYKAWKRYIELIEEYNK